MEIFLFVLIFERIQTLKDIMSEPIKGRGAQRKVHNRFFEHRHELRDDFLEYCEREGETPESNKTQYIDVFPKTFVNKVDSPDVGMMFSANPYQGCEHGCVYCYARNTHEYWGYGPGLDFERNILIKRNAPELLEEQLRKKSWSPEPIVFSGNTDCYQPVERRLEITRKCLEIMLNWRNPAGIITKNALILRDLDILTEMAALDLIAVNVSITSLSEETRRLLEPRTASIKNRLKTVETLSKKGIPVRVMMAPIIPSLNSHEILPLLKRVSELGARDAAHTMVRLNGAIGGIFEDWVRKTMPERADRILNQIADCHGGRLNDSRWGTRMVGEGQVAQQVSDLVKLGRSKYFKGRGMPVLNTSLFRNPNDTQMKLF